MSKAIHILLSKDEILETCVCKHCGLVPIAWKNIRGIKEPRCSIGVREQRSKQTPESRRKHKKGPHGLTVGQAQAMRAKAGKCTLCGSTERLAVDHCHATKVIRGVLCRRCNLALGYFRDSIPVLEAAIRYLQTPEGGQAADT